MMLQLAEVEEEAEQRSWVGAGGRACQAQAACWRSPEVLAGAQHGEKLGVLLDVVSHCCQARDPVR